MKQTHERPVDKNAEKLAKLLTRIDKRKAALDKDYEQLKILQKDCSHKFKKISETSEECIKCRYYCYWDHLNSW